MAESPATSSAMLKAMGGRGFVTESGQVRGDRARADRFEQQQNDGPSPIAVPERATHEHQSVDFLSGPNAPFIEELYAR